MSSETAVWVKVARDNARDVKTAARGVRSALATLRRDQPEIVSELEGLSQKLDADVSQEAVDLRQQLQKLKSDCADFRGHVERMGDGMAYVKQLKNLMSKTESGLAAFREKQRHAYEVLRRQEAQLMRDVCNVSMTAEAPPAPPVPHRARKPPVAARASASVPSHVVPRSRSRGRSATASSGTAGARPPSPISPDRRQGRHHRGDEDDEHAPLTAEQRAHVAAARRAAEQKDRALQDAKKAAVTEWRARRAAEQRAEEEMKRRQELEARLRQQQRQERERSQRRAALDAYKQRKLADVRREKATADLLRSGKSPSRPSAEEVAARAAQAVKDAADRHRRLAAAQRPARSEQHLLDAAEKLRRVRAGMAASTASDASRLSSKPTAATDARRQAAQERLARLAQPKPSAHAGVVPSAAGAADGRVKSFTFGAGVRRATPSWRQPR